MANTFLLHSILKPVDEVLYPVCHSSRKQKYIYKILPLMLIVNPQEVFRHFQPTEFHPLQIVDNITTVIFHNSLVLVYFVDAYLLKLVIEIFLVDPNLHLFSSLCSRQCVNTIAFSLLRFVRLVSSIPALQRLLVSAKLGGRRNSASPQLLYSTERSHTFFLLLALQILEGDGNLRSNFNRVVQRNPLLFEFCRKIEPFPFNAALEYPDCSKNLRILRIAFVVLCYHHT